MPIRRLEPADAAAYRQIMLLGYDLEPQAFTSTVAEREPLPLDWWHARLDDAPGADAATFGAFADDRLVGVAGVKFRTRRKTRHKAWLFGMFVRPEARGRGIARRLVEAVLDHARSRPGVRILQLTVTEGNAAAVRLYESCGFRAFGTEPFALRADDGFLSLVHMWRQVESA